MAYCVPVECDLLRLDLPILHIYLVSTQNHRDVVADSTEAKGRQSAWKLSQASRFATDEHSNAGSSKLARSLHAWQNLHSIFKCQLR